MATEIERKFLVSGEGWRAAAHERIAMRHGYLAPLGGAASVRAQAAASLALAIAKALSEVASPASGHDQRH